MTCFKSEKSKFVSLANFSERLVKTYVTSLDVNLLTLTTQKVRFFPIALFFVFNICLVISFDSIDSFFFFYLR